MTMRKLLIAAVALAALAGSANAAEKYLPMTIDFVGDWCFDNEDAQGAYYKLPSWIEGQCKNILSINKWAFSFTDDDLFCQPVAIKTSSDTAPSGTNYDMMVSARCWRSGQLMTMANGKPSNLPAEPLQGQPGREGAAMTWIVGSSLEPSF
jgi:hypothetical protein